MGWVMGRINLIAVRSSAANINRRTLDNLRAAGLDGRHVEPRMGLIRVIEAVLLREWATDG